MYAFARRSFVLVLLAGAVCLQAQQPPGVMSPPMAVNAGTNFMQAQFSRLEYGHRLLSEQQKKQDSRAAEEQKELVDAGVISALDLQAPAGAVREFNTAVKLQGEQKVDEAILHLQKAIKQYRSFASAHLNLGFAYRELDDNQHARAEFEQAVAADPKFPGALIAFGRLELAEGNVEAARTDFERAAALRPRDISVLMLLCYAQHGTHQYRHAIDTAAGVHKLEHLKMANVHYIAASSAIALSDYATVKRELEFFVQEDPTNPLAPSAQENLKILARAASAQASGSPSVSVAGTQGGQTFPNSERLRGQLAALGSTSTEDNCADCRAMPVDPAGGGAPALAPVTSSRGAFTVRKSVDEVAVFFAVTSRGHMVTDLQADDVKILDANRPPEKLLQFTPQSKLPLRLGLLIDTSGSIRQRFAFEKDAATKFVQKMLSNASDLAFVAGFADTSTVTQDFTASQDELSAGIQKLGSDGGTALFDAVSFICWKLAAYPERERVANVLVLLSDGEDNSSRTSLTQAIRDAEAAGVTIYTISTKDRIGPRTDADKILVELAERTGGEAIFPSEMVMLGRAFDKLHDIIRSRYLVAYRPADFTPNGAYRAISIVAEKDGHRFQVHTRKGYYARLAANSSAEPPQ